MIHTGYSEQLEIESQKPEDYEFLGASKLSKKILVPNSDWREFRPKLESQRNKVGTDGYTCTNFSNNNASEIIHKMKYGEEINYSDRFSAVVSGTRYGIGNSHGRVAEHRRKKGSVLEADCPFTDNMTLAELFAPVTREQLNKGLQWTVDTEYGYEKAHKRDYVEALQYSPLVSAVDSSTTKTSGFRGLDHSIVIDGVDEKKKEFYVFDSYRNKSEVYDWDYPFAYALRFHYEKIIKLTFEDMALQLVKGSKEPAIYLVDFDGKKHHIDAPTAFVKLFGDKAWDNFVTKPQAEVDALEEGERFSIKGNNVLEALKELVQNFGKKVKS